MKLGVTSSKDSAISKISDGTSPFIKHFNLNKIRGALLFASLPNPTPFTSQNTRRDETLETCQQPRASYRRQFNAFPPAAPALFYILALRFSPNEIIDWRTKACRWPEPDADQEKEDDVNSSAACSKDCII